MKLLSTLEQSAETTAAAAPPQFSLLGANGAIGRTLAPLLSARGMRYRVVGRNLMGLQVRFHDDPLAEHFVWQPENSAFVQAACAEAENIVFLIGAPLWKYEDLLPLTEQALAAAKVSGARRFLLLTPNWSYGEAPDATPLSEDAPRQPATAKGRIRRQQEDMVLAAHAPGTLSTAVLRMADLFGPKIEASHLWSTFQAAKRGTAAQVLGPVDTPHEFLFVPDAAETVLRLFDQPAAWEGPESGKAWNLGGSGITTIRTMVEAIFAAERKEPKYNVPGSLMMRVVRSVNPYIRELKEMQYLLDSPLLLDDSRLGSLLPGGLHRTPYDAAIRQTLAAR